MKNKLYKNKSWLEREYRYNNTTKRDMAKMADCGRTTISRYIEKFGITRRRNDPELIEELYWEDGMTVRDISKKFNCGKSSILRTMNEYDIPRRDRSATVKYQSHTDGRAYMIFRSQDDFVYEHRLLAVAEYGFEEVKNMHVHHKNEIKWDNRPDNLELMTPSEHIKHHHKN